MLLDHVREFFYLHAQVGDPMNVNMTEPALFFTRLVSHLCAPVFIALTGLSAWIYGNRQQSHGAASRFLFKRGLFLILLEWSVINFAWTFDLTPAVYYLQVIWVIGLSMISLAVLLHLRPSLLLALAIALILGHNLLDHIRFDQSEWAYTMWTILHDRGYLSLPWGAQARTSYPLLPWIGVIAIGYVIGPWFASSTPPFVRQRRLLIAGLGCLLLFLLLRSLNMYGEPVSWEQQSTLLRTAMSFFNLTKYPPSADFLLLTLGCGAILLCMFERLPQSASNYLVVFGAAPLFFYILHLYLLHILNRSWSALFHPGQSGLISVPNVLSIWLLALAVSIPCWFACRWFAARKRQSKQWWMRYL